MTLSVQLEESLSRHSWTCPPRGPLDLAVFEAVPRAADGLEGVLSTLHGDLARSGPTSFKVFAKRHRIGVAAMAKLLADLAGRNLVRDVSYNAEARSEVWGHECRVVLGAFGSDRLSRTQLTSTLKGNSIRTSNLCVRYLVAAGFLEGNGIYGIPASFRGEAAVAEAVVPKPEARSQRLAMSLVSEMPRTVQELQQELNVSGSRVRQLQNRMKAKGLLRLTAFMGEDFLVAADMDDAEAKGRLTRSGRVEDPAFLGGRLSEAMRDGFPRSVSAAAAFLGCSLNSALCAMNALVEADMAWWGGESGGILSGPYTVISSEAAKGLPAVRFQYMLLAGSRLGTFTSVEINRFLDSTVMEAGDRPNRCVDMEIRHGMFEGLNSDVALPGKNVSKQYRLTAKGEAVLRSILPLPHIAAAAEIMDAAIAREAGAGGPMP